MAFLDYPGLSHFWDKVKAHFSFSPRALESELLQIASVTHAKVYMNRSGVQVDGVPAGKLACVVRNGSKSSIAQKIYDMNTSGLDTYGSTSQTVTSGDTIYFSRPTTVYVNINVVLKDFVAPDTTNISSAIQTAVTDYVNNLNIGESLKVYDLRGVVNQAADATTVTSGDIHFDLIEIQASTSTLSTYDTVPAAWDEKLWVSSGAVTVSSENSNDYFSIVDGKLCVTYTKEVS